MKYAIAICLLLSVCYRPATAQKAYTILESHKELDPSRYDEIKGSPYLYNDWLPATVVGSDGKMHENILVNYNGLTGELEIKRENRQTEMEPSSYLKVMVHTPAGTQAFYRGIHPQLGNKLVCVLYDGVRVKLIRDFKVRKQENEMQTPLNPTVFEKFVAQSDYYLMLEGLLHPVKIKKKKIMALLDHKQEIEKYIKENNLNLNTTEDVIKLLAYYETTLLES
ncbi:MAG TPA: hypothetical protein ENJ39_07230 [Flammeovirgaceae bacterium]|nr:hypothetical protein [Flammeovirgaceae bacterium]